MSPSVAVRTWGRTPRTDVGSRRPLIALVIMGLVVAALIVPQLQLPAKVPPMTINNPGDYSVMVEASNGNGDGWVPIALVPPHGSTVAHEVIDQGSQWTFRFTAQGQHFTGYAERRADLAAANWNYAVPDDISTQLHAAGVPASP